MKVTLKPVTTPTPPAKIDMPNLIVEMTPQEAVLFAVLFGSTTSGNPQTDMYSEMNSQLEPFGLGYNARYAAGLGGGLRIHGWDDAASVAATLVASKVNPIG